MTYNVFSGTLNPTHFTSLHLRGNTKITFFTQMLCSSWTVLHAVRCLPERKIVICDVFDIASIFVEIALLKRSN